MGDAPTVRAGDSLPPLRQTIELAHMIAYAGATWDWHRLHYDPEFYRAKGLDAPIVDGQAFGAYLAAQLLDFFGPRARLRRLGFRFRSMVFAGETITCNATVVEVDERGDGTVVRLDLEVRCGDRVAVAPAHAEVIVDG